MAPLFRPRTVSSVAQYVKVLSGIRMERLLWFRGQTESNRQLKPTLPRLRGKWLEKEALLTARFRQNARPLLPAGAPATTEWDWLLLMQHYGVPTRLLDWTENPLASLYFAVVSMRDRDTRRTDGCVFVLDPIALNKAETELGADIPTLGVDHLLDDYLPSRVADSPTPLSPVAVLAERVFPRMVAQSGVFTLVHQAAAPIEEIRSHAFVGRMVIPGSAKAAIADELSNIGVTRLSLFPELSSAARLARSYLK